MGIIRTITRNKKSQAILSLIGFGMHKEKQDESEKKKEIWVSLTVTQKNFPKRAHKYALSYEVRTQNEFIITEVGTDHRGDHYSLSLPLRAFSQSSNPQNSSFLKNHPCIRNIQDYAIYGASDNGPTYNTRPAYGADSHFLTFSRLAIQLEINTAKASIKKVGDDVHIKCGTTLYIIHDVLNLLYKDENGVIYKINEFYQVKD